MYPYQNQLTPPIFMGNQQPVQQQQFQFQPPQRPVIFGRMVNDLSEISANDVPMDGSAGYFPSADGTSIYKKVWLPNGTIQTIRYVPEIVEPTEPSLQRSEIDELREWLDGKFEALAKTPAPKARKEEKPND